jgi:hypothetical protein
MSNNKGSALIFTLMVILILSVLGVAVIEMSLYEYKVSYAYANSISVDYSAEAGLDIAKGCFNNNELINIKNIMDETKNNIINQYQQINQELLYTAVYQAVRKYLEGTPPDYKDGIFTNYIGKTYLLDDNVSGIKNATTISSMKITDTYIFDKNNPLPKFTIQVETMGTYRKLKKYGHAVLILDLNKQGNPLSIKSWIIDLNQS